MLGMEFFENHAYCRALCSSKVEDALKCSILDHFTYLQKTDVQLNVDHRFLEIVSAVWLVRRQDDSYFDLEYRIAIHSLRHSLHDFFAALIHFPDPPLSKRSYVRKREAK